MSSKNLIKNRKKSYPAQIIQPNYDKQLELKPQNTIFSHNKPSKSTTSGNNEQLYIKSREKINNCNTRAGGLAWLRYRLDMKVVTMLIKKMLSTSR